MSLAQLVLAGEVRAVARAARLVDDRMEGYRALLRELYPHTGKAWVLGVTGAPGVGKSTLTAALVRALRDRGQRVGVVAIDPTSPLSGGALLGDRIRMQRHFEDPEVFIRSLATRGALGGLSRSADDVVAVLDAWGAQVIVVETVGVGQDELDIAASAHTTLVVLAPGMGDEVQASKAGLLECADVFVVNKADRPGADAAVSDLEAMLLLGSATLGPSAGGGVGGHGARHLAPPGASPTGWAPQILRCVATRDEGVEALVGALLAHRAWLDTPEGLERRRQRGRQRLLLRLRDELFEAALASTAGLLEELLDAVEQRALDPYAACERLVEAFGASGPSG